jgi:dUTP pyrophosphatase
MSFIYIKLQSDKAKVPWSANPHDAGRDLFAAEEASIAPLTRKLVSTDISIEIPDGYYGRIAPRSGLAYKNGIDTMAGVIDSTYRGVVGVILFNSDREKTFEVKIGDRIAQLIIESHFNFQFIEVDSLADSARADGGFGSTGTN